MEREAARHRPLAAIVPNIARRFEAIRGRTATVAGAVLLYCLLHWAIRLATSPVYSMDEAEQLLMSQSLDIGYRFRHPPLVTWIYVMDERAFGLSRPAFFAVKYVIMAVGLIAFYLAARVVFRTVVRPEQRADALAAASLAAWALVYYPAWGHHEDLTHTVLLFTCLSLTLHAFLAAIVTGGMRNWIYFGATIGFGFLSKYVHLMLPAALVLAAMTTSSLPRSKSLDGGLSPYGIGIALSVALAIVAPYFWWTAVHAYSFAELAASVTHSDASGAQDLLASRTDGLLSLVSALAQFSLPLSLLFPILFWRSLFGARDGIRDAHTPKTSETLMWRQLMLRTMLLAAAMYVAAATLGAESFKARWMHQIFLPLPIWLFLHAQSAGIRRSDMRTYGAVVAFFLAIVPVGRLVEWNEDVLSCRLQKCWSYLPVKAWAADLRSAGVSGGTIVGADYVLSGNLRALMPNERVFDSAFDASISPPAPAKNATQSCVAVWRNEPEMPLQLRSYLLRTLQVDVPSRSPDGSFRHGLLRSQSKASTLYYRRLQPSPICR